MRGSDGTEGVPEGKVVVCGGKAAKFFRNRRHRTDATARLRRRRQSWVWFLATKEPLCTKKEEKKRSRERERKKKRPPSATVPLFSFFLALPAFLKDTFFMAADKF